MKFIFLACFFFVPGVCITLKGRPNREPDAATSIIPDISSSGEVSRRQEGCDTTGSYHPSPLEESFVEHAKNWTEGGKIMCEHLGKGDIPERWIQQVRGNGTLAEDIFS